MPDPTRPDPGTLLRTRGGISRIAGVCDGGETSSPHTRRYFPSWGAEGTPTSLFSAHAEVFPIAPPLLGFPATLLRTRGGISRVTLNYPRFTVSSPHTRRYFRTNTLVAGVLVLFSAHAEVFPGWLHRPVWGHALLRTRGGISLSVRGSSATLDSSPHTRRYFQPEQ